MSGTASVRQALVKLSSNVYKVNWMNTDPGNNDQKAKKVTEIQGPGPHPKYLYIK